MALTNTVSLIFRILGNNRHHLKIGLKSTIEYIYRKRQLVQLGTNFF